MSQLLTSYDSNFLNCEKKQSPRKCYWELYHNFNNLFEGLKLIANEQSQTKVCLDLSQPKSINDSSKNIQKPIKDKSEPLIIKNNITR